MSKKKTENTQEQSVAPEQEEVQNPEVQAEQPVQEGPSEVERLTALAEDYKRKWYSVSAEYDNYRKRNATAVASAFAEGKAEAIKKLLPVADNFGYAYEGVSDEKTKAGIDKVIKSFYTILASLGVEPIEINAGDAFDESVAEAIMSMPGAEGEVPGTVKQVLKKGYRQDGKVIRFAQVITVSE